MPKYPASFVDHIRGTPTNSIQDVMVEIKSIVQKFSSCITACANMLNVAQTYDAVVSVMKTFVGDVLMLVEFKYDESNDDRIERHMKFVRAIAPIEAAASFVSFCIARMTSGMYGITMCIDDFFGTDFGGFSRNIESYSGLMLREVYTRLKAAGINDRFCKSYLILLAVWMPYAMLFYLRDPVLLRRRPRAAPGQETFWYHWLMPWRWFRWFPHNEENYPFRAGTSPDRQRNTMPDGEATFIDWKPNAHGQTKLEKIIYKNVDTVIRQYSHAQESQAAQLFILAKTTSILFMKGLLGALYITISFNTTMPATIATLNAFLIMAVMSITVVYACLSSIVILYSDDQIKREQLMNRD